MEPFRRAQLLAAGTVLVLLARGLATEEPSPQNGADGAADFARLARAPGERLQKIAEAAYLGKR
jgi:hypothetical protein